MQLASLMSRVGSNHHGFSSPLQVTHVLTDAKLRALKRKDRLYRVADRDGLCVEVPPVGALRWRFRYRFANKAKMIGLGVYPAVSLAMARERLNDARSLVAKGIDPSAERQASKRSLEKGQVENAPNFRAVAEQWMARQQVAEVTASKSRWIFEKFLFPDLGDRPISEITARELLTVLRKIEDAGLLETAKRAKIKAGQVFRFAVIEDWALADPTPSLRGALRPPKATHHAAIVDPKSIGELLRAIDGFRGQYVTLCALRLAPLLFVRPGELRQAEWEEVDIPGAIWRIPAPRMKMREPHLVPLSSQSIAILQELRRLTGGGRYVFPGLLTSHRPLSENTINAALRRLGYSSTEMTGHGFRTMAATRLNEEGWNPDAIERQLV